MPRPTIDPLEATLNELGKQGPAMRRLVETWCAQNSGSNNLEGLAAMREILASAFTPLGGVMERLAAAPVTDLSGTPHTAGGALRIHKHPEATVQILLSGHMDTVYGADSAFQKCRETAPGVLVGPGVADMKGGLVVMLKVLEALEGSPWAGRIGWTVLITGDEETGSLASEALIAKTAAGKDLALVFEAARPGGALVGTRKGAGSFLVRATGRAAHTGLDFEAGRNAIVLLAEFLPAVHALNQRFPGFSLNIGTISGGSATNIVADSAQAEINLRLPAGADPEAVFEAIEEIRLPLAAREGFDLELSGRVLRPAMELSPARLRWIEVFQETAHLEGLEIGVLDTGGGSDGNAIHACGVPVLDGIALRGGKLHSPKEFLELDSLTERARLITRFLLRLARGDFADVSG